MNLQEALKIKKKSFKYYGNENDDLNFQIIYKDSMEHSFINRVKERTDLTPKEVSIAISKGVDYILKRVKSGKIDGKLACAITFKKSNFKVVYIVNTWVKFLKIATILSSDMETTNAVSWNLKENVPLNFEIKN
jgi:hypothetical protein